MKYRAVSETTISGSPFERESEEYPQRKKKINCREKALACGREVLGSRGGSRF
jgi:hypothetical protein